MKRKSTDYIVVHCSATPRQKDIGRDEIDQMHKDRGWSGIGYHLVIRRHGLLETGRKIDEVGAHVKGFNRVSVGICMVGGIDDAGHPEDNFTSEQRQTLRSVLMMLEVKYPGSKVCGHRDMSPDVDGDGVIEEWEWLKACPCFDVAQWWADVREVPV